MSDAFSLAAAIFSAIATGLAAFATWRAPTAAARLAETLRRDSERAQERQKNKLHVFAMLMQERAAIYSENAVRALNLIDVVFVDSPESLSCRPPSSRSPWPRLAASSGLLGILMSARAGTNLGMRFTSSG
jgi:hypothetical protein